MKSKILDYQALSGLSPGDVTSWLRANGWTLADLEPERLFRFTKGTGAEQYEVEVPFSASLRDHARRMAEVLDVLEVAENLTQTVLLRDIRQAQVDILRIRIISDSTRGGRIPVGQGAVFFDQTRDMVLAAACAATARRPAFTKRKPTQAMDYLRMLKYGPSEEGSYVATIESPVPPALQLSLAEVETDTPFERRVMLTLAGGLRATSRAAGAASGTNDISPFVDAVGDGLNSNLCDAVAGMLESFESTALEIGFGWAHSRPAPIGGVRVHFSRDVAPLLREAARCLRDREPLSDFEIEGYIVKLESDDLPTGGSVVVACPIEGRMRRVRATLDNTSYPRAIEAHGREQRIALDGELVREGAGLVLRSARNFRVPEET